MTPAQQRHSEYRSVFEQCTDRESELQMLAYTGAWGELNAAYHLLKRYKPQDHQNISSMERLLEEYPQLPQIVYDLEHLHDIRKFERLEKLSNIYTDTASLLGRYAVLCIRRALDIADKDFKAVENLRAQQGKKTPEESIALHSQVTRLLKRVPNIRAEAKGFESPSPEAR